MYTAYTHTTHPSIENIAEKDYIRKKKLNEQEVEVLQNQMNKIKTGHNVD